MQECRKKREKLAYPMIDILSTFVYNIWNAAGSDVAVGL
jgi:hypothetical protein